MLTSDKIIYAEDIGSVSLETDFTNININNVWYVPKLTSNFYKE